MKIIPKNAAPFILIILVIFVVYFIASCVAG